MKIKVLLVMPNKEVQIVKIPGSIKFIKAFLGNNLFYVKLNKETMLIASEDAKVDEFNRLVNGNIVLGTFLIVSIKKNRRVSMRKKDIRKFSNMFKLRKHEKKINHYKEEYLEDYYTKQKLQKQKNAEINKRDLFNIAA